MSSIEPPDLNDDRWLEFTVEMEAASEAARDWNAFVATLESIRARYPDLAVERLEKALAMYALQAGFDWQLPTEQLLPNIERVIRLSLSPAQWIRLAADFHRWSSGRTMSDEERPVRQRLMEEATLQRASLTGRERSEANAILAAAGLALLIRPVTLSAGPALSDESGDGLLHQLLLTLGE